MTIINKLFSKKFADSGSPAYDMLKKMSSNEDQEQVAKAIAGDHQDPDQAGADWVKENQDKVDAGSSSPFPRVGCRAPGRHQ